MSRRLAKRGEAIAWVMAHIDHDGEECLIWPFTRNNGETGYGQVKYDGKIRRVHRVMCQIRHGEPPTPDHEAAHECGNGMQGCVNPKHLVWKTRSENQLDRKRHGTAATSLHGSRGKISRQQRQEIREMKGSMTQREIAKRYGVHFETISRILRTPERPRKIKEPFTISQIRIIRAMPKSIPTREIADALGLKSESAVQAVRSWRSHRNVA